MKVVRYYCHYRDALDEGNTLFRAVSFVYFYDFGSFFVNSSCCISVLSILETVTVYVRTKIICLKNPSISN